MKKNLIIIKTAFLFSKFFQKNYKNEKQEGKREHCKHKL